MVITAAPLHSAWPYRLMKASRASRPPARSLGAGRAESWHPALSARAGRSFCTRFGVFEAGQQSARDPKYTVVPQRERLDRGEPIRYGR